MPITTWPTSAGAMPARSMAALQAAVARVVMGVSFREPPKEPIAVRAAPTTRI
ncbi:hypothetical protein D9M71_480590 [compost metagenome]